MNSDQLKCAIQSDSGLRSSRVQVLARDHLSNVRLSLTRQKWGCIVNTDTSNGRGVHWISIWFDGEGTAIFFDSYGHSPSYYNKEFPTFIGQRSRSYKYNTHALQQTSSRTCGFYALYFVLKMSRAGRTTLSDITSVFSNDKLSNDIYVSRFICKYFQNCMQFPILCE